VRALEIADAAAERLEVRYSILDTGYCLRQLLVQQGAQWLARTFTIARDECLNLFERQPEGPQALD